jgi:hypothetical protein
MILSVKSAGQPETRDLRDMRGDGVLYLWNGKDPLAALGFHEATIAASPTASSSPSSPAAFASNGRSASPTRRWR